MISDTQTRYGSGRRLQGRSRFWRPYQRSSARARGVVGRFLMRAHRTRIRVMAPIEGDHQDLIYDWNVQGESFRPDKPVELDDETLRDGLQGPSVSDPPIA